MTGQSVGRGRGHRAGLAAAFCACLALSFPASAQDQQTYGPPVEQGDNASAVAAPKQIPSPLSEAVARALDDSPLVLAAKAELLALDADFRSAKWLRYPSLSAELLAATRGSSVADADGLAANIALEQPIWGGGIINNRIDVARETRQVGYNALREMRLAVLLGVVNAYFDVVFANERAAVLEQGLADHGEFVGSIERRVAAEVSPFTDLRLARTRVRQLEIELAAAREASDAAYLRLVEFVGEKVPQPIAPDPSIMDGLPTEQMALADGQSCNPTLDVRRSQIDVAEAQRAAAKSDLFPQLLLQLSQNEITGSRAAIVLRAQTGSGLAKISAIDSADARIAQSIADLGQADRELRTQLRREYITLRANRLRADNGAAAVDATLDLQASYQRQFVTGRRSWLDLLNVVREVTSARQTASDARVSAATSAARIWALACRWQYDSVIETAIAPAGEENQDER